MAGGHQWCNCWRIGSMVIYIDVHKFPAGNLLFFLLRMASPADLVKVHCQMEGKRRLMGLEPRVHSAAHAFRQIVECGGIKGLWKGSLPNVHRAALVNLGDLTTYDWAKRTIMNKTGLPDCHTVHIMASICAGLGISFPH